MVKILMMIVIVVSCLIVIKFVILEGAIQRAVRNVGPSPELALPPELHLADPEEEFSGASEYSPLHDEEMNLKYGQVIRQRK